MPETLSGAIDRVTFHNPENGFAVLRVMARGQKYPVTVVGQLARAVAGELIEAEGTWNEDPEHGRQFRADSLRTAPPSTLEGIEKYLGSGLIKGIGPRYAQRIVEVFGAKTLQIIDESPSFLKEVKGLGARRIGLIRESWKQQKAVRDILVFLQSHGLGLARAFRIYKMYGDQAVTLVQSNPYRLASDIWGMGFQTADALAEKLGIDRQSPLRAKAGLLYAMDRARVEGHCALPEDQLLHRTGEMTGIDGVVLNEALATLTGDRQLKRENHLTDTPWIYATDLFDAEQVVAQRLIELLDGSHPLPRIDLDVALDWVEKRMHLTLARAQREAIAQAAKCKVLVITGGPGVGKTTLVRGILEIFQAKKLRVALAAPTGRAAKRLAESTGQEAKTLHRLLELGDRKAQRNRDKPLEADLVLVDETSMVDLPLMMHLVQAVPDGAALILVGDVDQLPSVGPGSVLGDIIASRVVPTVRLTEIFRQAETSGIIQAAHRVLEGAMPVTANQEKPGDFYIIETEQPADILDRIITMVRDRIPTRFHLDPTRDIQVLTPMNRSDLGTRSLNARLQEVLNPQGDDPEVERFGWTFRVGDKVLQTANDYEKEVFNGDIGRISRIDLEESELEVRFDEHEVSYSFEELDELALAYALTIHKSQGSEYPAVVIPLHTQHYLMLQRNLLYTAITRGKKLVVLVGSPRAIRMAIERNDTQRRFTCLAARLIDGQRAK